MASFKIFVDDSGKKEYATPYSRDFVDTPPALTETTRGFWRDNYFVLCAVRVPAKSLGTIDAEINELKTAYFGTKDVEVKSDWLRNPTKRKKKYVEPLSITAERLNEFGERFTDLVASHADELKLFAAVFDKRFYGDRKRSMSDGDPLLKTTQVIFERIHRQGGENVIVFDQMEDSLRKERGKHGAMLKIFQSNDGMKSAYVPEYTNITDIYFDESHTENFLQIADTCAYNVHRQFLEYGRQWTGQEKSPAGEHLQTYPYFSRIRHNFAGHEITDVVRGVGIVCIPDPGKKNWRAVKNKKTPPRG